MRPILYLSTIFLTAGLFIACNNNVSTGDTQATEKNPTIQEPKPGDIDGDGILDENDNCPTLANADQADGNSDGIGDVCEDLDCASNFCEDHAFLSDRHCDGGFSVGCSAQSDGCLVETSRMNCSEGCQSEGDLMGECKPKPRDLTDPLIDSATGTMTHGSTLTITGEDFGEHDLNIEWTGEKIENTALGTNPRELGSQWTYRQLTPNAQDYPHISNENKWSGNKSIDLTLDAEKMCNQSTCAVRFCYDIPQGDLGTGWNKIFFSYYFYLEAVDLGDSNKMSGKHLWIADNSIDEIGQYPFGSNRNNINHTNDIYSDGLSAEWRASAMAFNGCSDLPGTIQETPYLAPTKGVGYDHPEGGFFVKTMDRGGGAESISQFAFNEGEWVRLDYYYDYGTPDTYDSEVYVSTFRPLGQGTQHGLQPGLWIGKWVENASIYSERSCGTNFPVQHPNLIGWYLALFGGEHVRYFLDDVYIQVGTRSRVILGNAANYEECTKTEIQYPTAWSDNEIQFTLNKGGSFQPGEQAYIFVINENEYDQGDRDAFGNGHYDFAGVSPGFEITLE